MASSRSELIAEEPAASSGLGGGGGGGGGKVSQPNFHLSDLTRYWYSGWSWLGNVGGAGMRKA